MVKNCRQHLVAESWPQPTASRILGTSAQTYKEMKSANNQWTWKRVMSQEICNSTRHLDFSPWDSEQRIQPHCVQFYGLLNLWGNSFVLTEATPFVIFSYTATENIKVSKFVIWSLTQLRVKGKLPKDFPEGDIRNVQVSGSVEIT